MNTNNQDELVPRPQAARLLREMFPEADSSSIASACWRVFQDGQETCTRAELIKAIRVYLPLAGTVVPPVRDFRLKRP